MNTAVAVSASHSLRYLPWRDLTPAERRNEVVRYAAGHNGRAVTLNLHEDFEVLVSAKEDPMREIQKRMNRELKQVDLNQVPIMLVLEATRPDRRLHLHGVFIASAFQLGTLQQSMRAAVGYVSGRSGSRQFHSKTLYDADGWWVYIRKDRGWTKKITGIASDDKLWWTSHSMTALVRENYEQNRLGLVVPANTNSRVVSAS